MKFIFLLILIFIFSCSENSISEKEVKVIGEIIFNNDEVLIYGILNFC